MQDQYVRTLCRIEAEVEISDRAETLLMLDVAYSSGAEGLDDPVRIIGGAVIRYDDFQIIVGLPERTLDGTGQIPVRTVVGRNGDGN